jgi:hypothetical protein
MKQKVEQHKAAKRKKTEAGGEKHTKREQKLGVES